MFNLHNLLRVLTRSNLSLLLLDLVVMRLMGKRFKIPFFLWQAYLARETLIPALKNWKSLPSLLQIFSLLSSLRKK